MRKLTIVLLLIGFQLQLLAQESTEPQALNKFYGGIEPHFLAYTGSYVFGGVRYGKDQIWAYETGLGTQILHPGYWYSRHQFVYRIFAQKQRMIQIYFEGNIKYTVKSKRWPQNLSFWEYYDKNLLAFAQTERPLGIGGSMGFRGDIFTTKLFRIQGQVSVYIDGFPSQPLPLLGIRLTTK